MAKGRTPALATAVVLACLGGPARSAVCEAPPPLAFGPPVRVDTARPGADPSLVRHPSGALLLTAQPLVQKTEHEPDGGLVSTFAAQSPVWRSRDGGASWAYLGTAGLPAGPGRPSAGTADPDLTADGTGALYHVELAGPAALLSRSDDGGGMWRGSPPAAAGMLGRPWVVGDEAGMVYLVVDQPPRRPLLRSVDGGITFARVAELPGGHAKPALDRRSGALYASFTRLGPGSQPGPFVALARMPGGRAADFRVLTTVVAPRLNNLDADAAGVDAAGNVYVAWTQVPRVGEPGGVWYAYSRDGGATFSAPQRVDDNPQDLTVTMPAVVGGGAGRVAIAWLQSTRAYRRDDPRSFPDAEWRVHVAVSTDAAGCDGGPSHWTVSVATPRPVHRGPICGSTLCDLGNGRDSRMGEFLAGTTTDDGRLVLAYPDTTSPDPLGGDPAAVAHPAVVVASGGPAL